jgi:ABC transporter substrate binding protein
MFGVNSAAHAASRSAKTSRGAVRNSTIVCPSSVFSVSHRPRILAPHHLLSSISKRPDQLRLDCVKIQAGQDPKRGDLLALLAIGVQVARLDEARGSPRAISAASRRTPIGHDAPRQVACPLLALSGTLSELRMSAGDAFFDTRRERIIAFAAQSRLPTIYQFREFATAGGLMTYGISITEGYRQTGVYAGQILKGAKPGELPVHQSIKFELVINLKTAKALGIEIRANLLALADDVIE